MEMIKRKTKFVMVSQRCTCGHKLTAALTKFEKRDIECLCGKIHTLTGY